MTYEVLLISTPEIKVNTRGLDVRLEKTSWDYLRPFQKYDMIIVDNGSINTRSIRIATRTRDSFQTFMEQGGVLVCLSSQPKNYGGYSTYAWLPNSKSLKLKQAIDRSRKKSLKITRSTYERLIENQKGNLSVECYFTGVQQSESESIIAATGLDDVIAFSRVFGEGLLICVPQSKDREMFLNSWLTFWLSKRPEWVEKFEYKQKKEASRRLRTINVLEKLLYGNDRELRDAVITALKILGFDARPSGKGTVQDIDLSYGLFTAIAEVKGLKSHADRDDIRALLDYYDANVSKQPQLKGIFVVNHYREVEPGRKGDPYTDGALDLATRKGFCLLMTDDLYFTIEKVLDNNNFKELTRRKIFERIGLVKLQS